ncbi:MAG: ribonuclease P protein component [Cellvibrionaceae bacterium]
MHLPVSDLSFGKQLRLLNAADFKAVFDDAPWRSALPQLLVLSRPNPLEQPRLGLIIAKKHVKLATDRNRLKRLIRESFRLNQHTLPKADIIVLARPGLGSLENPQVSGLLEKSWKRLNKVSDPNFKPSPRKKHRGKDKNKGKAAKQPGGQS